MELHGNAILVEIPIDAVLRVLAIALVWLVLILAVFRNFAGQRSGWATIGRMASLMTGILTTTLILLSGHYPLEQLIRWLGAPMLVCLFLPAIAQNRLEGGKSRRGAD